MDDITKAYLAVKPSIDKYLQFAAATYAANVDADELRDVAVDAFLYAYKHYNAKRGASFPTFMRTCLVSRVRGLATTRRLQHERGHSGFCSVKATRLTDEMASTLPAPANAADTTAYPDNPALDAILDGLSIRVAARKFHCSYKEVYYAAVQAALALFGVSNLEELETVARQRHLLV